MTTLAADIETLRRYAGEVKPRLFKEGAGILRHPYLAAGTGAYARLIEWGGMSYLSEGAPAPLRDSLINLLEHIGPDGKGQRVIGPEGYGAPAFQNRPFLATGAFVLSRELGTCDWLPPGGWKKLRNYLLYWHVHRPGRHGLLKWLNVDEGFADNGLANWSWDPNSVEAVDLNAQLVLEHSAAAWMAERLGREEEALEQRQLAEGLHHRIEAVLWDDSRGCYFSSYNPPERKGQPSSIRCVHYTNLWPLWLGLAPRARAVRVIEGYVLSPEHFWSDHGIRSMSRSDLAYNNAVRGITLPMRVAGPTGPGINNRSSNWQGPIWSITNYLVALALKRYGYAHEAQQVAERVTRVYAASVREHGSCYENYHAETGEPLCAPSVGSWNLMPRHLPGHLDGDVPWILQDLPLPTSRLARCAASSAR